MRHICAIQPWTLYSQSWLNDAHSTISNGPEKDFCKTIASGLIWNWSDFLLHFLPSFGSFWSFLPMTAPVPNGSLSAAKSLSLGWLWKWNSFLGILGRQWIKAYDSKNHSWVCYPWLLPLYIGKTMDGFPRVRACGTKKASTFRVWTSPPATDFSKSVGNCCRYTVATSQ